MPKSLPGFDEYEKLGEPHPEKLSHECTRYIIPENTMYALEITLKKGFDYGDWDGVVVEVVREVNKPAIGGKFLSKPTDQKGPLPIGIKYVVDRFDGARLDGKMTHDATLTFRGLNIDETLSNHETDVPGVAPLDLGDITICTYRYKNLAWRDYPEKSFQTLLKSYQDSLLTQAKSVDQKSFEKHGITHAVGVEGGTSVALEPPKKKGFMWDNDRLRFAHYLCRSQAFFEPNSITKCPIPIECQPWDSLKDHERQACFKTLQAGDKDRVLMQKISEAGPGADKKAIQRQLLELGEIPNRWRGWGQLYKRERQALFENLQLRRSFWEKGEIPPEDRKEEMETKPLTGVLAALPTVKEEPVDIPTQSPPNQTPTKEESGETPPLQKAKKPQPAIIIVDDSPPRANKRSAACIPDLAAPTIKNESTDLENLPASPMAGTLTAIEGGPVKKVKLEPGLESTGGGEDKELLRLKEEDERQEQELQVMQRMADIFRQRNERKSRISALEAKIKATPKQACPN